MSDTDATQARQDVVVNVDEIIEHVINANMLNMPYEVYSELFDAVDGLGVEIENLQSENAKLREERDHWHVEQVHAYGNWEDAHKRAIELEKQNAKLREELAQWERLTAGIELPEYPITEFQPKDLERENANLLKLADAVKEFVEDTHCEDCPCRSDCDDNNRIFCVNDFSYHAFAAMRELGMEAVV